MSNKPNNNKMANQDTPVIDSYFKEIFFEVIEKGQKEYNDYIGRNPHFKDKILMAKDDHSCCAIGCPYIVYTPPSTNSWCLRYNTRTGVNPQSRRVPKCITEYGLDPIRDHLVNYSEENKNYLPPPENYDWLIPPF
jgi:hypothetical protein